MQHIKLATLTFVLCVIYGQLFAQGLQFLDCPSESLTLCAPDARLVLPDNNQIIIGEGNPDASTCSAHLRIQQEAESDCGIILRYFVDYYPNNGATKLRIQDTSEAFVDAAQVAQLTLDTKLFGTPEVILDGLDYNQSCPNDPGGFHRIEWSVLNECDDVTTCSYLIRLEDCMGPIAEPEDVTTIVFPVSQEVIITAQEFVESAIDDCSPVNWLLYSFSESVFNPIKQMNCDSIAENGGPLFEIDIWVADAGVDRDCSGAITWDERARTKITALVVMEDDCMGEIFDGTILSENMVPVPGVTVSFHGGPMVLTAETDEDGEYRLPQLIDSTASYTIIPTKSDGVADGVSTLDLVKIQKHLLGIEMLDSPYKMIAADANNNRDISVTDLLELRKLILRITETLPNNSSWRFVAGDHVFADPQDPWTFPEFSDLDQLDFVGIKIGDVNGTLTEPQSRNYVGQVKLHLSDRHLKAGEYVSVPVTATEDMATLGLQFTLNTSGLQFHGVSSGKLSLTNEDVVERKEGLVASWYSGVPIDVVSGDVLFYVEFNVTEAIDLKRAVKLSSDIVSSEIYVELEGQDMALTLQLEVDEQLTSQSDLKIFPNPSKSNSAVQFTGVLGEMAEIVMYDVHGRIVFSRQIACVDGANTLALNADDDLPNGLYYVYVHSGSRQFDGKLVIH